MSQSSKRLLTANQLVPVNRQYAMATTNKKIDLINLPCPPASKIIGEILLLKLPQATANNHAEFVEALELGTMIKFLNILG
ncbi:hypothetical protein Tco_0948898 [Tanacetum coccineum]